MPEWCSIREFVPSKSGKTMVWSVEVTGFRVGVIGWYSPWRKYAFFPQRATVYEHDCLRQIANFCETETKAHRQRRLGAGGALPQGENDE